MKKVKNPAAKNIHLLISFFDVRIVRVFFIFIIAVSAFLSVEYLQSSKRYSLKSNAAGIGCQCSDPGHCAADGCSRDKSKLPSVCEDYRYDGPVPGISCQTLCVKPPDCCNNVAATGDVYQCCWIERAYCTLSQCHNSTKGGCAWYWIWHDGETNKPDGYCCMQGSSPETMKPRFGSSQPSNTPIPPTNPPQTVPPTIPPTIPPTVPPIQPTATPVQPTVPPGYPTNTPYIRPSEPLYTVTPPLFSSPTRPYSPYPSPTYYFPPTGSPNGSPNPSTGPNPTTIISINPQPTTDDLSASPVDGQPTSVIAKPIINFPNPEPVIRKAIGDTKDFIQRVKKSLEDFFRVVLP